MCVHHVSLLQYADHFLFVFKDAPSVFLKPNAKNKCLRFNKTEQFSNNCKALQKMSISEDFCCMISLHEQSDGAR